MGILGQSRAISGNLAPCHRPAGSSNACGAAAAKRDSIPLDQLEALCADDDRVAAKARRAVADAANNCRGSLPKTTPTARFDKGMTKDFKAFAKAVGRQLNLTGCWTRPKPKPKKRKRRHWLNAWLRGSRSQKNRQGILLHIR